MRAPDPRRAGAILTASKPSGMLKPRGRWSFRSAMLRLSQLLAPDPRIPVVERIAQDLNPFLDAIEADGSIDPMSLKINSSVAEIAERIEQTYGSNRRRAT